MLLIFIMADFKSISNNTILSRTNNVNTYWYGFRSYYCNYVANANKIHQRSKSITSPYLVYSYYTSYYNAMGRSLFSNNEIIGYATGTYYGMYIYYGALDVYNNSILLNGTTTETRTINVGGNNSYVTDCRNNNILNLSTGGFPIYVSTTGTYSGDYNNLYSASSYVGYYGGNKISLTDWTTASGQDVNSVRLLPVFLGDSTKSLKLFDYTGLSCPAVTNVSTDIEGTVRAGNTGMGAYSIYPTTLNAAALGASNWNNSLVIGQNQSVNAIIANMGTDTLVSVDINWSFNGVLQTAYAWSGKLNTYQKDTILIGTIMPVSGLNTIRIWTSNPNNGVDDNNYNDTTSLLIYGCDSLYHGMYTVGGLNDDFPDLTTAMFSIGTCGLGGPTELWIEPGIYDALVLKNPIKGSTNLNTLTLTSKTANADDVRFVVTSGIALSLDNVNNIFFRSLSFDASDPSDGQGVNIKGKCKI